MKCADCRNWLLRELVVYESGETKIGWQTPNGIGRCLVLDQQTDPNFGCTRFKPAQSAEDHSFIASKQGAMWQHWRMVPCPVCGGTPGDGEGVRCRCAGIGQVRLYDDGHLGDERIRKHPKQIELEQASEPVPELDPGTLLQPLARPTPF